MCIIWIPTFDSVTQDIGVNPRAGQQREMHMRGWTKPQVERYKCNVDACLFSIARNEVGIGSCIRDDQGRLVKL